MYDILFEGARIVDGQGGQPYQANVATLGSTIALIGREHVRARTCVDASRMVLCPGFIDMHAHSELYALRDPSMPMKSAQGITSDISGNCGIGVYPQAGRKRLLEPLCNDVLGRCDEWDWDGFDGFIDRLSACGTGINMGFLQPHSPLRTAAMGEDSSRAASPDEIAVMCSLLEQSLEEGCFGLSTGLYYQPCFNADDRELEALLRVVARHDGLFCVHMRSEGDGIVEALEEVLSLAMKTSVRLQISHLKIIGGRNQDKLSRVLDLIHSHHDRGLDVAFDQYPYDYGSTSLFSLLPPWANALSRTELRFALQLDGERRRMRHDMLNPDGWESIWSLVGPENIRILHMDSRSDLDGTCLADLGPDPLDALFDVLADEGGAALMCDVTETRSTLERIMQDDLMGFSTDALYSSASPHPRSHSAAVELIRRYCLDRRLFPLEECIHRMSRRNALRLGLEDRGVIREGAVADLVLMDLDALSCQWHDGCNPGIRMVCVNGAIVHENGRCTGLRPGSVLLKNGAKRG